MSARNGGMGRRGLCVAREDLLGPAGVMSAHGSVVRWLEERRRRRRRNPAVSDLTGATELSIEGKGTLLGGNQKQQPNQRCTSRY